MANNGAMPVPLLDLKAQFATIKDQVMTAVAQGITVTIMNSRCRAERMKAMGVRSDGVKGFGGHRPGRWPGRWVRLRMPPRVRAGWLG